jgi:hypothetical protein
MELLVAEEQHPLVEGAGTTMVGVALESLPRKGEDRLRSLDGVALATIVAT